MLNLVVFLVGLDTIARKNGSLDAAAPVASAIVAFIAFWITVIVTTFWRDMRAMRDGRGDRPLLPLVTHAARRAARLRQNHQA